MIAEGFASPSVAAAYGRAAAISSDLAESAALVPTLYGLWNYQLTRADFRSAQPLAERLEVLARHPETDRVHALFAHNAAGTTHWFMGRPAQAEPHVDAVLGSYDVERDSDQAASFGEDPGVVGNMYGAIVRQLRAVPDAAERHFEKGMEIASTIQQPFGMAQMLWAGALIARERNDVKLTLERAQQLIRCCRDNDVTFWLSGGYIFEGWANVATSGTATGIARIREGIEQWIAENTRLTLPFSLALLADAYLQLGRARDARQALDQARRHMQESGERWYAAEIYRLSGLVERQQGDRAALDRAASEIGRAAHTAKSQHALFLEGRAIANLHELTK
jgi:predicted ATPase